MSLRDLLDHRRSEIEAQIKALKSELEEIRVATAAISGSPIEAFPRGPGRPKRQDIKAGSIKEWVLRALAEFPDGMQTDDVIRCIEAMGGPVVPRNSMTPQLSRLKGDDNLITLDGRLWKLLPPRSEPDLGASFGAGTAPTWELSGEELI